MFLCSFVFKNDEYVIGTKIAMSKKILTDFSGTQYILKEGNNCYSISSINGDFIEGSLETNSPYYDCDYDELYYLGFGNYYYRVNNSVYNLIYGDKSSFASFDGIKYSLDFSKKNTEDSSYSSENNSLSKANVDADGFTKIPNARYFSRLFSFPENVFGECGIVSLCMLLGYFDTFYDDRFVNNNATYTAKIYDSDKTNYVEEIQHFIEYGRLVSQDDANYTLEDVSIMPGTTQGLHDYLCDMYMVTILGLEYGDFFGAVTGNPMDAPSLYETMNEYLLENCNAIYQNVDYNYGSLFYTHATPKEIIDSGYPVILVLISYDLNDSKNLSKANIEQASDTKSKFHNPVAYGYKDDTFLVHAGWNSGTLTSTSYIVSNATINGYFSMTYDGHQHSENIPIYYSTNGQESMCGCGFVNYHEHNYRYVQYNANLHTCVCIECGYQVNQNHKFVQSLNVPNKYCVFCGYQRFTIIGGDPIEVIL